MGIPVIHRPRIWRLFLDYEPISSEVCASTLAHKRADYFDCLGRLFSPEQRQFWTSSQKATMHQIEIDLPRTRLTILHHRRVIELFQHVLFIWAVRHPASGYVQGMNDILLPFFLVFIQPFYPQLTYETITTLSDLSGVTEEQFKQVEADCFWCFGKLLDGIQDVFTKGQPGLFMMLEKLAKVVEIVNEQLSRKLESCEVHYNEFAFEWMNCLLVRQFGINQLIRVWDEYVCWHSRIGEIQVNVCAAMLELLTPSLLDLDQGELMSRMQHIGPSDWTNDDVESILAQAFVYEKKVTPDALQNVKIRRSPAGFA